MRSNLRPPIEGTYQEEKTKKHQFEVNKKYI